MPVNTLKELLRLRLGETYSAEQEVLPLLDAIETETQSRLLRDRLRDRREEARRHMAAVEKSLELLGTDAPRANSPALRGLCEERRAFVREAPGPVVLESFHVDILNRVSHYKLAGYLGLLALARELGQSDIAALLDRCARDELAAAAWLGEQRAGVLAELRPQSVERPLVARPA